MRKFFLLPALFLTFAAASPSGCEFTPNEQALIQRDLAALCPQIDLLDPHVRANFNGNVALALSAAELACPPNPPPTDVVTILTDLIIVGEVLAPRLHSLAARQAVVHVNSIAVAHGVK